MTFKHEDTEIQKTKRYLIESMQKLKWQSADGADIT